MTHKQIIVAVPSPTRDLDSLVPAVSALKHGMEILTGQTGRDKLSKAVTWGDLVDLGLIDPLRVPK